MCQVEEVFVGIYLVFIACNVQGTEIKKEEWLDPGDMLNTDLSSFKTVMSTSSEDYGKKETPSKPKTNRETDAKVDTAAHDGFQRNKFQNVREQLVPDVPKQNCEIPYFKQLTRTVVDSFERRGKHYVKIELSKNDLETLKEFKDKDNERIYDVLEIVSRILSNVEEDETNTFNFWSRVIMNIEYNKEIVAILVIVAILSFILLIIEYRTSMSWSQQFWYFLVGLFIISIPWEWFRLYRKEFANKQTEMMKEFPPSCIPNKMTISQSMSLWMSNMLTWKEDECAKYQEAILVDPVWEVSPSQAFSITATRFFAKPLEYIADACGRSFKAFFIHVPAQWQPFMFLGIMMMLVLCLLIFTKSRIKLFFFEIGPASQPLTRLHRDDVLAIGGRIGEQVKDVITKEIRGVQERQLEVHEEKLRQPVHAQDTCTPHYELALGEEHVEILDTKKN